MCGLETVWRGSVTLFTCRTFPMFYCQTARGNPGNKTCIVGVTQYLNVLAIERTICNRRTVLNANTSRLVCKMH